jgi:hypothetical protein
VGLKISDNECLDLVVQIGCLTGTGVRLVAQHVSEAGQALADPGDLPLGWQVKDGADRSVSGVELAELEAR